MWSFTWRTEQLYRSLEWVASLPGETRVFGGHDYLLENLRFATASAFSVSAVERRRKQYKRSDEGTICDGSGRRAIRFLAVHQ